MLDDHLVKNRALLDYKKRLCVQVAILEFFQRGDPMNLVLIKKLLLGLLLDELRLEIMLDDHLVQNRAFLDYKKKPIWSSGHLGFLQRGDPMNIVPN